MPCLREQLLLNCFAGENRRVHLFRIEGKIDELLFYPKRTIAWMGSDVGCRHIHEPLQARASFRELQHTKRAGNIDRCGLGNREVEPDGCSAMDDVAQLGIERVLVVRSEPEIVMKDVACHSLAVPAPSGLEPGEAAGRGYVMIETLVSGLSASRPDEEVHLFDVELLAAAHELFEYDLPHESGAAGDEDARSARLLTHVSAPVCSGASSGSCAAKMFCGSSAAFICSRHSCMAGDMMSCKKGSLSFPTP